MSDLLTVVGPMLLILAWVLYCDRRSRRPDPPPARTDPVTEVRAALYGPAPLHAPEPEPAGRHRKTCGHTDAR